MATRSEFASVSGRVTGDTERAQDHRRDDRLQVAGQRDHQEFFPGVVVRFTRSPTIVPLLSVTVGRRARCRRAAEAIQSPCTLTERGDQTSGLLSLCGRSDPQLWHCRSRLMSFHSAIRNGQCIHGRSCEEYDHVIPASDSSRSRTMAPEWTEVLCAMSVRRTFPGRGWPNGRKPILLKGRRTATLAGN